MTFRVSESTRERQRREAPQQEHLTAHTEAVLFAIYYAMFFLRWS
jgi:hypothetical protein